jgi:hypothetical protein
VLVFWEKVGYTRGMDTALEWLRGGIPGSGVRAINTDIYKEN